MNKKILAGSIAMTALIAFCVIFLDLKIAAAIRAFAGAGLWFDPRASDLPDLLFATVAVLSIASWGAVYYLKRRNVSDSRTRTLKILGTSLPLAFALKEILKWFFGRLDTRIWTAQPELYGFHWFHGLGEFQGFPSGHMLVFTPIFLAIWSLFPKLRILNLLGWLGLAAALVVTLYHFLGDVIAGAYIGWLLYHAVGLVTKEQATCLVREEPGREPP